MLSSDMKVPKNRQTRLSDDVWLAGEAIARHFRMSSARDGFEAATRDYVLRLSQTDPRFAEIWEKVKAEGVEEN
ncbi:hypothetical protein [Leptolyngbya sp. GGD]|uniref:hypothetical protein n=1 Tax=Leptolyngbya sp. GGD TaxID=2997907 RepID=UPI00227C5963|nr:hypothetical protein [Leptolyngbya sp. GGD]MCY6493150.1 hypothetical protein [Leptolyngbya sp. GGD]